MMNANQLLSSFVYAWRGIWRVAREEQNFRIQLLVAVAVIVAMFALDVSRAEKALLVFACVFVLVLELLNSVFERIADLLKPRLHEYVEELKDVMAGAVLVATAGAVLVGAVIFLPYLLK